MAEKIVLLMKTKNPTGVREVYNLKRKRNEVMENTVIINSAREQRQGHDVCFFCKILTIQKSCHRGAKYLGMNIARTCFAELVINVLFKLWQKQLYHINKNDASQNTKKHNVSFILLMRSKLNRNRKDTAHQPDRQNIHIHIQTLVLKQSIKLNTLDSKNR